MRGAPSVRAAVTAAAGPGGRGRRPPARRPHKGAPPPPRPHEQYPDLLRGFPWVVPTCPCPRPAQPTKGQGNGQGWRASSAGSRQVPRYPSRLLRGSGSGQGELPCCKTGPPPPPGKSGNWPPPDRTGRPTAPTPPPGEQSAARPRGLRCARSRWAAPPRGRGEGRAPPDTATHPAAALRVPGLGGRRRQGGRADAGRSLDPPAPARLRRLPSAASHRLAGPAAAPGEGSVSDPSPVGKETAHTGHYRARLRSAVPPPPPAEPPNCPSLLRSLRGRCAGPGPAQGRRREAPPRRETMRRRRPARGCRALRPAGRGPASHRPARPEPPVSDRGAAVNTQRWVG